MVINQQSYEDQILIEYVVLKYDHPNLLVPAKLLMSAKKKVDSNNFVINISHLYPLECPLEGDYSSATRLNIYFYTLEVLGPISQWKCYVSIHVS